MDHGLWRDRIILDEFIVIVHSIEWDVSLLTLYGGEFTFSTHLIKENDLVTLLNQRGTKVSLKLTPFIHETIFNDDFTILSGRQVMKIQWYFS